MELDVDRLVSRVEEELRARADADRAQPMADYMKTTDPFYGVQAKPRREILKELGEFKPTNIVDYERAVRALWSRPERETRYLAIDYAKKFKKFIKLDSIPLYEELIRTGQWWDFVDDVATHLVGQVLRKDRAALTPLMKQWIDDDDMWIRRTAIISQNRHKEHTDEEMLFDFCIRRMHEKEFFIRKAIGWALRDYSYAAPDAVKAFLLEHRATLSGLSFREGAKQLRREGLME